MSCNFAKVASFNFVLQLRIKWTSKIFFHFPFSASIQKPWQMMAIGVVNNLVTWVLCMLQARNWFSDFSKKETTLIKEMAFIKEAQWWKFQLPITPSTVAMEGGQFHQTFWSINSDWLPITISYACPESVIGV